MKERFEKQLFSPPLVVIVIIVYFLSKYTFSIIKSQYKNVFFLKKNYESTYTKLNFLYRNQSKKKNHFGKKTKFHKRLVYLYYLQI